MVKVVDIECHYLSKGKMKGKLKGKMKETLKKMVKDNSIVLSEWLPVERDWWCWKEKKEILTYPLDFSLVSRSHLPVPLFLIPGYIDFSSSLLLWLCLLPSPFQCPSSPLPYLHFSGYSVDFVNYHTGFPDFHLDLLLLLYPGYIKTLFCLLISVKNSKKLGIV